VNVPTSGSDPETIDTGTIPSRYDAVLTTKTLMLGGNHRIHYDMDKDMLWRYDVVLKTHPNGMRFSCFDQDGTLLATNEYFSVGGGFVVNEKTQGWQYGLPSTQTLPLTGAQRMRTCSIKASTRKPFIMPGYINRILLKSRARTRRSFLSLLLARICLSVTVRIQKKRGRHTHLTLVPLF
jgi:hypothetical protein